MEERSYSIADPTVAMLLGYTSPDGVSVSESGALTLAAVWRAVSLIAGSVAALPLRTLQDGPDGQRERVGSFLDHPGGRERLTSYEWTEVVLVHLLLHGNSYLQHIRNRANALVALWPVHPQCVSVEWDDSRPGGKVFTVRDGTVDREFDATEMTQIMGISLDGLRGLSPIGYARLSLANGIAADKAASRMFTSGAMISGLVTPSDPAEAFTEDEAKIVKESVNRTMIGPERAGDIAVVNRSLKFTPWSMSAEDAQFLQSRTYQVDEVGRWFGIPPHLLGLTEKSTSWGQGIAEQNRGLARYTLTPWTSRIEQRLTRLLPAGRIAEYDYTAFVRPAPEDEISLLINEVNSGLLTLNEARRVRNLPPLPGGDVPRTPAGAAPTPEVAA